MRLGKSRFRQVMEMTLLEGHVVLAFVACASYHLCLLVNQFNDWLYPP